MTETKDIQYENISAQELKNKVQSHWQDKERQRYTYTYNRLTWTQKGDANIFTYFLYNQLGEPVETGEVTSSSTARTTL